MRKFRLAAALAALVMTVCLTPALAAESDTPLLISAAGGTADSGGRLVEPRREAPVYTDMAGVWCQAEARLCSETGLLEGFADGSFRPRGTLTAAQSVAVAARLYDLLTGGDGKLPSADGDAPWYQGYYAYLAPVLGYEDWEALAATTIAYPSNTCGRYSFAVLLSAVLEKAAVELPVLNRVTVIPDLSPQSQAELPPARLTRDGSDAVLAFYNAGILNGTDAYGTLSDGALTRGQAAAMLARIADPAARVTFTPRSFDLCRDILGLEPDAAAAILDGTEITAEEFSYAFAVRFTSGLMMEEDGSVTPLAATLPEAAENALAFLVREECAARLAAERGYAPTAAETAALEAEAAQLSGYGGLSEQAWLYELRQTAAVNYAYSFYESTYGETLSPLFQTDGGGEWYFLNDLNALQSGVSARLSPALQAMDWAAAAKRIAASPYGPREILSRARLCGWYVFA